MRGEERIHTKGKKFGHCCRVSQRLLSMIVVVVVEDCMNRDKKKVAYCEIDAEMSGKHGITRDYYTSKWEFLRSKIVRDQTLKQKSRQTSSKASLL